MSESYLALVTRKQGEEYLTALQECRLDSLPENTVLVRVQYSSLNYKDALSATGNPGVTRAYPHTPGIDAAGEVVEDASGHFRAGDPVLVTGHDLGMNTPGGFGEYIRVPVSWVLPMPGRLSAREAMLLGTAGFTAALCVDDLLSAGVRPEQGNVVVTGATGGVGSLAVSILAREGFRVEAVTGKGEAHDWLREIGASEVLSREDLADSGKPMLRPRWAGAVDTVGGEPLATVLKSLDYSGAAACCGLAASPKLEMTVFPFILRNVRLLGVDSVEQPIERRRLVWEKLAYDWCPENLEAFLAEEVTLDHLEPWFAKILEGSVRGRVLVRV